MNLKISLRARPSDFVEMRRRYSDTIHLFILAVPQQLRGQHIERSRFRELWDSRDLPRTTQGLVFFIVTTELPAEGVYCLRGLSARPLSRACGEIPSRRE